MAWPRRSGIGANLPRLSLLSLLMLITESCGKQAGRGESYGSCPFFLPLFRGVRGRGILRTSR